MADRDDFFALSTVELPAPDQHHDVPQQTHENISKLLCPAPSERPRKSATLRPSSDGSSFSSAASLRPATPPPPYGDHVALSAPNSPIGHEVPLSPALQALVDAHRQQAKEASKSSRKSARDEGLYNRLLEKISNRFKNDQPSRPMISWPLEEQLPPASTKQVGAAPDDNKTDFAVVTPVHSPTQASHVESGDLLFRVELEGETPAHEEQVDATADPYAVASGAPSVPSIALQEPAGAKKEQRPSNDGRESPTLGYHHDFPLAQDLLAPPKHSGSRESLRQAMKKNKGTPRRRCVQRKQAPPALDLSQATVRDSRLPRVKSRLFEQTLRTPNGTVRVVVLPSEKRKASDSTESSATWFDASDEDAEPMAQEPTIMSHSSPSMGVQLDRTIFNTWRKTCADFLKALAAGGSWLAIELEGEAPLEPGHVRVRWTCKCGEKLYDDFIEQKPGAARELEIELNCKISAPAPARRSPQAGPFRNVRGQTQDVDSGPSSAASSGAGSAVFSHSSSWASSTLTTPSSTFSSSSTKGKPSFYTSNSNTGPSSFMVPLPLTAEPPWLLTVAAERGLRAPRVAHVSVDPSRIRSDADLALALRAHHERVRGPAARYLGIRGLAKVEFVMFEMHAGRVADVRARPHMPPAPATAVDGGSSADDSPATLSPQHPYAFEPSPLLPPVGSAYMLHLLAHPDDFAGETMVLARAPKRRGRLDVGTGWGLELCDGLRAARVWGAAVALFAGGSVAFAAAWLAVHRDIQGAFAVAGWFTMFVVLAVGWIQAYFD